MRTGRADISTERPIHMHVQLRSSKARPPPVTTVDVHLPLVRAALHPETAALLLRHIIQQLLFMRRQIEQVYPALLSSTQTEQCCAQKDDSGGEHDAACTSARRQRRRPGQRRLLKDREPVSTVQFVAAVEELLPGFRPELFAAQAVTRIALLFGPSPNRPVEIYDISVHTDEQAQSIPDASALLHTATRSLIAAAADMPEGPASKGPTKLHVLALLPDSAATAETVQMHGFRAKRGFVLKQRRGQHVRLSLGCSPSEGAPVTIDPATAPDRTVTRCSWYQAKAAPRGLTMRLTMDS